MHGAYCVLGVSEAVGFGFQLSFLFFPFLFFFLKWKVAVVGAGWGERLGGGDDGVDSWNLPRFSCVFRPHDFQEVRTTYSPLVEDLHRRSRVKG
jgi:hypothetical protein